MCFHKGNFVDKEELNPPCASLQDRLFGVQTKMYTKLCASTFVRMHADIHKHTDLQV